MFVTKLKILWGLLPHFKTDLFGSINSVLFSPKEQRTQQRFFWTEVRDELFFSTKSLARFFLMETEDRIKVKWSVSKI